MNIVGTWRVTKIKSLDKSYLNLDMEAFIGIEHDNTGEFQFGFVSGVFEGKYKEHKGEERFAFKWEGNDELREASGSGWIEKIARNRIKGKITFSKGDVSRFQAVRID